LLLAIALQLRQLFFIRNIDLRSHHNHRLLVESCAKASQFAFDHFNVLHRVGTPARIRNIHHMHQQPRALDVPQKLYA
jgi:hypothetical protein